MALKVSDICETMLLFVATCATESILRLYIAAHLYRVREASLNTALFRVKSKDALYDITPDIWQVFQNGALSLCLQDLYHQTMDDR